MDTKDKAVAEKFEGLGGAAGAADAVLFKLATFHTCTFVSCSVTLRLVFYYRLARLHMTIDCIP